MKEDRKLDCMKPFEDAAQRLGIAPDVDARGLKRAYRRAVAAHPPDRDPEGFREVRDAFELLSDPAGRLEALAVRPVPYTPPPALPPGEPLKDAELAAGLVRRWAAHIDVSALLREEGE